MTVAGPQRVAAGARSAATDAEAGVAVAVGVGMGMVAWVAAAHLRSGVAGPVLGARGPQLGSAVGAGLKTGEAAALGAGPVVGEAAPRGVAEAPEEAAAEPVGRSSAAAGQAVQPVAVEPAEPPYPAGQAVCGFAGILQAGSWAPQVYR